MNLLDIIHGQLIISNMTSQNKGEVLEELLDLLVEEHEIRISDRSKVLEALLKREKSISTGLTDHVAIPHATTDAIEDLIGVLGISKEGIAFDSLDGKPAKIFCLLLIPESGFRQHIKTLAGIARLMNEASFRKKLIFAQDKEEIKKVIAEAEGAEFL